MPAKIEISYKTIIFAAVFIIFLRLLYEVKDIIFLVFVAFILMSALKPWVLFLQKYKIPKTLSVVIIYLTFLSLLGFITSAIVPPLIHQSSRLGENLPDYLFYKLPFVKIDQQLIIEQFAPLGQDIIKVTLGLFNNIVALFTIFIISFYLIIERNKLEKHLSGFMGGEGAERLMKIINKIEERLGDWVRGQASLMISIGLFTFIGLTLLGVQYVLPLAIIAGLLEIIPTIGPIISAVPAVLVALTVSPLFALAVAALYFVIQQLENHIVVPLVMNRVVGLPPLVTLLALLIGGRLAGISGAIMAIPVVVTVETVIAEYFKLKEVS